MVSSCVKDVVSTSVNMCVCVSLQQADRVDVEMVEEVCVGRASIGALVFHKVTLQGLLATVALLYHPQLKKNDTQEVTLSKASPVLSRANLYTAALHIHTKTQNTSFCS